jgi:hypothetical protein
MLLPTRGGGFDELTVLPKLIAADKTKYIELLDKSPKYQYLFLRPRRWGKSTFLETLAHYYDKSRCHIFEDDFRDFYIGRHPTSSRNSLLVLRFDFSSIGALGTIEDMKQQFHDYMFTTLETFLFTNQEVLKPIDRMILDSANGARSLNRVLVSLPDLLADLLLSRDAAGAGEATGSTAFCRGGRV